MQTVEQSIFIYDSGLRFVLVYKCVSNMDITLHCLIVGLV